MNWSARTQRLFSFGLIAAALALWEAASHAGALSVLFFPPPSQIARETAAMLRDGTLASHAVATILRLLAGTAIGAGAGVVAGVFLGWSPALRRMLDPLVAALHPLPKIALLPLLMVILGIGESSKVAAIAFASFFPMLINTSAGVRHIPHGFYEVIEAYGGTRRDVFRRVVLPGSLPMVLAGLRVTVNTALMIAIAIEFVAAEQGLGRLIWSGWQSLRTERLWAGIVLIGIIGVISNAGMQRLSAALVHWQPERDET